MAKVAATWYTCGPHICREVSRWGWSARLRDGELPWSSGLAARPGSGPLGAVGTSATWARRTNLSPGCFLWILGKPGICLQADVRDPNPRRSGCQPRPLPRPAR